ncbi:lipoprotein signal peptidase [Duganella sp. BJB488]|uniref:signal peptidase II n=1 Tax=unclassified Duganella TaxID=2636909 RepID=UPI000E34981C|nr:MULTISPECIES: signal peptidase II [unclassified Duganella]NVD73897.1 lipoprotein signal peptidase [Duganella sp. BJB1802]RFP25939.1 lipoprotein signal peptidase [Duganella sp. BJB489]RFP28320.1 lipoprotein signal peptidase [Duganella sp. BJB488]RFP36869.1 lipoprotein signal peptidase [Duganella sp. BJB480]
MATKKIFPTKSSGSLTPWLGIAAIVVLFDQLSKITITKTFQLGEEKVITSFFNLVLAYNKGAAFSFLQNSGGWQRYFFTAIALCAAAWIIVLLKKHGSQRMFSWALSLILGGAIGNVIDRILYGHVVDFLDFHWNGLGHFPAFNVADSAICIGAALFILDELRRVNR